MEVKRKMDGFKEELKAEAVKWLKDIKDKNNGEKIIKRCLEEPAFKHLTEELRVKAISRRRQREQAEFDGMERFIEYFFNITEEDLK